MLDYETLRVIWWLLLGTLLTGFAVTDGFDLGTAALVRVLGRDDDERRCVLETVEPIWEGNQVWIILGGGAVFAAWPLLSCWWLLSNMLGESRWWCLPRSCSRFCSAPCSASSTRWVSR